MARWSTKPWIRLWIAMLMLNMIGTADGVLGVSAQDEDTVEDTVFEDEGHNFTLSYPAGE